MIKLRARNLIRRHAELVPIYVVMILMIAINIWKQPNFFAIGSLTRLCNQLAPYLFIGMAQMCVMIIGGMDFALGGLVSLSTCIFAKTMVENELANFPRILLVILLIGLIDACVGWIIGTFGLPTIVVTLATSFVFEGLALGILPTPGGYISAEVAGFLTGRLTVLPVALLVCALFVALWAVFRRSSLGLLVYAVGKNKSAAFYSGLPVRRAYVTAFFLSGIFAAMAGLMLSARTMSGDPTIANDMTINAVTAAVLGGVTFSGGEGKMAGTIAGAVVVGMLVNVLFYLNITGFYTYFVQGVILMISVVVNNWRKREK